MRGSSALKCGAFAFILMLSAQLPAAAYTQEDIDACTPDAMRLCQQAFPNKSRIVLCLMQNKRQLNAACTLAFNRARTEISSRSRPDNVQMTKF
jgi:type II secretory pathway component PulL